MVGTIPGLLSLRALLRVAGGSSLLVGTVPGLLFLRALLRVVAFCNLLIRAIATLRDLQLRRTGGLCARLALRLRGVELLIVQLDLQLLLAFRRVDRSDRDRAGARHVGDWSKN